MTPPLKLSALDSNKTILFTLIVLYSPSYRWWPSMPQARNVREQLKILNAACVLHIVRVCVRQVDSGCALDHAFTHHWRVSYNKRARLGGEEERALSRVNGARHLTLSAPISAQRGAHASTAHARWASRDVGDLRTALLYSSRAQRFLFPVVLFPLTIN